MHVFVCFHSLPRKADEPHIFNLCDKHMLCICVHYLEYSQYVTKYFIEQLREFIFSEFFFSGVYPVSRVTSNTATVKERLTVSCVSDT